jgi:hypothetical protein
VGMEAGFVLKHVHRTNARLDGALMAVVKDRKNAYVVFKSQYRGQLVHQFLKLRTRQFATGMIQVRALQPGLKTSEAAKGDGVAEATALCPRRGLRSPTAGKRSQ